jgi:hypothetical protein
MLPQMIGRAEAGEHHQLRGVDRACGQQHLAGLDPLAATSPLGDLHTDRPLLIQQHPPNQHAGTNVQVRAIAYRLQIRRGGGASRTIALSHLVQAEARLSFAVEVVVGLIAGAHRGLDHQVRQFIVVAQVGDTERATRAMPCTCAAAVVFTAQEPWQNLFPRPARIAAELCPGVIVGGQTADVTHGVDRTGAAEGAAAWPPHPAPMELWLRFGAVIPVEPVLADQLGQPGRHVDQRAPVGRPRLQQQDGLVRIGTEPVGQHAAGGAGTHDHIVVRHQDTLLANRKMRDTC